MANKQVQRIGKMLARLVFLENKWSLTLTKSGFVSSLLRNCTVAIFNNDASDKIEKCITSTEHKMIQRQGSLKKYF